MNYLLQVDFPYAGDLGEEFTNSMKDLAKDIANENGLVFKLWTQNQETKEAGGIYVFDNKEDANRYIQKHTVRLNSFGIEDVRNKLFEINEELSILSKASFLK